jgi:hypothetical protein
MKEPADFMLAVDVAAAQAREWNDTASENLLSETQGRIALQRQIELLMDAHKEELDVKERELERKKGTLWLAIFIASTVSLIAAFAFAWPFVSSYQCWKELCKQPPAMGLRDLHVRAIMASLYAFLAGALPAWRLLNINDWWDTYTRAGRICMSTWSITLGLFSITLIAWIWADVGNAVAYFLATAVILFVWLWKQVNTKRKQAVLFSIPNSEPVEDADRVSPMLEKVVERILASSNPGPQDA